MRNKIELEYYALKKSQGVLDEALQSSRNECESLKETIKTLQKRLKILERSLSKAKNSIKTFSRQDKG